MLEVYDYTRAKMGIHTKSDFAHALNSSRTVISSALNGNPVYLTDRLCKKICESFPGIFNLEYLLSGKGTLLLDEVNTNVANSEQDQEPISINHTIYSSILEAKNETIEALRQEIKTKDQYIELLKSEYDKLKQSTSRYDHILSDGPLIASEPFPDKD